MFAEKIKTWDLERWTFGVPGAESTIHTVEKKIGVIYLGQAD